MIPVKIDLEDGVFKLGDIAEGRLDSWTFTAETASDMGQSNRHSLEGNFTGSIKAGLSIPDIVPDLYSGMMDYDRVGILIVGVGGTGGYVIRDLVRYIYSLKEKGDPRNFQITLMDDDIVEQKNILRQNFIAADLGKYKAEVLANRYSSHFGLEIDADLNKFTYDSSVRDYNIIVGCIDNNEARRSIYKRINDTFSTSYFWIDSGNEKRSGQVVLGEYYNSNSFFGSKNFKWLNPSVVHLYPEILNSDQDSVETEVSCAERAVEDAQNIFVNMTAANHVLNFLRQVISDERLTVGAVEFNIKGKTEVHYLTKEYRAKGG